MNSGCYNGVDECDIDEKLRMIDMMHRDRRVESTKRREEEYREMVREMERRVREESEREIKRFKEIELRNMIAEERVKG